MEASAIEARRQERERLIELARSYVESLRRRLDLRAAAVAGSVARGDFNVWSDVDVLVVAARLPQRAPERTGLLLEQAPVRIQPVGYTPDELEHAWRRRNRLVREAVDHGVWLAGGETVAHLRPGG